MKLSDNLWHWLQPARCFNHLRLGRSSFRFRCLAVKKLSCVPTFDELIGNVETSTSSVSMFICWRGDNPAVGNRRRDLKSFPTFSYSPSLCLLSTWQESWIKRTCGPHIIFPFAGAFLSLLSYEWSWSWRPTSVINATTVFFSLKNTKTRTALEIRSDLL